MSALAHTLAAAAPEEKTKTAFYVAGILLALWALVASAVGIRLGRRGISARIGTVMMVVTAVLVVGAITAGILTSGERGGSGASAAASAGAAKPKAAVAPPGALRLAADPQGNLKFDKPTLSGKAGKVAIAFTNDSPVAHNVTIEQAGRDVAGSKTVVKGSAVAAADLKPGRYVFYCSVDGHRQAGMQGALTIK